MSDFIYSLNTKQTILVAGPLCIETQITPKQCFSPYYSLSCCMRIRSRSVTWRPVAHEANRWTFWTSCTSVSWKRSFLFILPNFRYSWLTEMRILVGRVLHTGTEITLKMWYLGCFWLSFCQGYLVNKRRHYSTGGIALHMFHGHYRTLDWVLLILDKSNFCVRKSLFPVHNAWISSPFDHLAGPLGFRSTVHSALNNTETVLFFCVFCIFDV